jgi:hypothetical protein
MIRRTTLWEDIGIGVLAGATIVLTAASWALIGSGRGVMLMNRIGPSSSELYVANADGTGERRLPGATTLDHQHIMWSWDSMPRFVPKPSTAVARND